MSGPERPRPVRGLRVVLWDEKAELYFPYLKKGSELAVIGQFQSRQHKGKLVHEVVSESLLLLRNVNWEGGEQARQKYNLLIGEARAEKVKIAIGSAAPLEQELTIEIAGRDTISGLPRKIVITSEEIREALKDPVSQIIEAVTTTRSDLVPGVDLVTEEVEPGVYRVDVAGISDAHSAGRLGYNVMVTMIMAGSIRLVMLQLAPP